MKKLQLTKKIPQFSAYAWDGTIESYAALVNELSGSAAISYHLSAENAWVQIEEVFSLSDSPKLFGLNQVPPMTKLFAGQYIVFTNDGVSVMTEERLKSLFDIVVEQKVYTGRLSGKALEAWNQSTIIGDKE